MPSVLNEALAMAHGSRGVRGTLAMAPGSPTGHLPPRGWPASDGHGGFSTSDTHDGRAATPMAAGPMGGLGHQAHSCHTKETY